MASFFDKFPVIPYDINGKQRSEYQLITNIFFRMRFLRQVMSDMTTYYEHIISDDQTPEILADRMYGDPMAHWVILLANNIIDPQYDWPLNSNDFDRYIINKYGSIENAQTTYHHYEKVVSREESTSGTITEYRYVINQANLASNLSSTLSTVPYDHYGNLAEDQEVSTYNLQDGGTVIEIISREAISNYDYEHSKNEAKRTIKVIKPEYYPQIVREFENLVGFEPSYIRKLR
jgi:hypothetical protein